MNEVRLWVAFATTFALVSCEYLGDVHDDGPGSPSTTYAVTVTNAVNYLNALVFNTKDGAMEPGPLTAVGESYSIAFKAVPGARLNFATMSGVSNDWFFAPSGQGIALFSEGNAVTGDVSDQVYLWDDGTEEEDPDTFGGMDTGVPDDDPTVRIVEEDVTGYLKASLSYDSDHRLFTLTIENVRGVDVMENPIAISPGIVVLHAQNDPFFDLGAPDRGHGLEDIAREGNPMRLYEWFTETARNGDPLRLSSSFTVLSPGLVYAFRGGHDPVFTEGDMATMESGLEDLAEDGNNGVMLDYLSTELGLPAVGSDQTAPVGPGQSLTFTIDVPKGYRLGFNTMFVMSNDWFFSFGDQGLNPAFGHRSTTDKVFLFDAGTETDQPVGLGPDQAPFQMGPDTGAADEDPTIRRVLQIDDRQFGKGVIAPPYGNVVVGYPKGSYNLLTVSIEEQ